jgi:hypothetical protein
MAVATERGFCIAAGSQGGGDGIFRIEADWSIRLIDPVNNVDDLAWDRFGAFDAVGGPTLYFGRPTGLDRYPTGAIQPGDHHGAFTEVVPSGDILAAIPDTPRTTYTLTRVQSGSHQQTTLGMLTSSTTINAQNGGAYAIVAGDTSTLPALGYVIVDARRLVAVELDGSLVDIAATDPSGDWRWTHATVASPSHELGGGRTVIYVLEFNPITEQNRVLRLLPP